MTAPDIRSPDFAGLVEEVERLRLELGNCFRLSGADTTNEPTDIATGATDAVADLRRDYDEACNEAHELRQRAEAAEAKLAAMEADAGKWRDLLRDCDAGVNPCLRDDLCDWMAGQGIDWRATFDTARAAP